LSLAGKFIVGVNTIMAANATSTDINSYVMTEGGGTLKLSSIGPTTEALFPVGTKSAYAPVWIINTGTADTISVSVMDDNTKPVGGGRVTVNWNIGEQTPGNGIYRIRLGWALSLEDSTLRTGSLKNLKFYRLPEQTVIGTGFLVPMTGGYSLRLSNITELGTFTVGTFTSLITGVEEGTVEIPTEFSLQQNYPNPFNPTTVFNYQLPSACHVRFDIFDILGRNVATLVNERKSAGNYNLEFNAIRLTSGVYFYRLQAGAFIKTKKLLLLK
jgi:hypothetical protein